MSDATIKKLVAASNAFIRPEKKAEKKPSSPQS
jgi:hypothetical protein